MTDALVEAVARAIFSHEWDGGAAPVFGMDGSRSYWLHASRAALAAIETSGTHVVAPVVATDDMLAAAMDARREARSDHHNDDLVYPAMLSARPKQEETP